MTMYFANFDQLIAMGGHGVYVWSAFAVTVAAMLWLAVAPVIKHRALLNDIQRDSQRNRQRQRDSQRQDQTQQAGQSAAVSNATTDSPSNQSEEDF